MYLLFLSFLVKWRFWKEEKAVRRLFYTNPAFQKCDLELLQNYRSQSPFEISKNFLQKRGDKNIYAYGETPLTVYEEIGKRCTLQATDHFIDLGAGRGRGVFFCAHRFGCNATGIEWIPEFVALAKKIDAPRVQFYCQDFFQADLQKATVIYLYGTCLEDDAILQLIKTFQKLPSGVKLVTVSFSLAEYDQTDHFLQKSQFTARFPWGKGEIFIQEKQ
jgi:SAM-dependent methyltransferase